MPLVPDVSATSPISVTEIGAFGRPYFAGADSRYFHGRRISTPSQLRGGLSYVTGRHSAEVRVDYHYGHRSNPTYETSGDVAYTGGFGPPAKSATYYAAPYVETQNVGADMGLYAQDKWTLRRLTLNWGIRWDYFNCIIPAQSVPANSLASRAHLRGCARRSELERHRPADRSGIRRVWER